MWTSGVIKTPRANAFTNINRFKWLRFQFLGPRTKMIIFAMTAHTSSDGMERELWIGNRETGCFWRWEVIRTDPFHMVSNRVVGMVCHRRCLNTCVFGENGRGGLHSGLGVTDEITPTQIIRGQGLKVEAWQSVKLTFLGVGMSNLFRFGKSPNFHIYDHKWSSDIRLSGTEAPMVWCMTCFCEWEKPAG